MVFAGKVWRLLVGIKDGLALLFLLLFFALLYAVLSVRPDAAAVREGALLLKLNGAIVEEPARVDPWTAAGAEAAVRAFAEREGAKLGAVAQPLRAALTGKTTSPGIFDVLAVLGRDESLARLSDQAL